MFGFENRGQLNAGGGQLKSALLDTREAAGRSESASPPQDKGRTPPLSLQDKRHLNEMWVKVCVTSEWT